MFHGDVGKDRDRRCRNANVKVSSVVMKAANKTPVLCKIKMRCDMLTAGRGVERVRDRMSLKFLVYFSGWNCTVAARLHEWLIGVSSTPGCFTDIRRKNSSLYVTNIRNNLLFVDEFRGIALSRPIYKACKHCYVSILHVCTLKFRLVEISVSLIHIELFWFKMHAVS